jgi:hypothetical protein
MVAMTAETKGIEAHDNILTTNNLTHQINDHAHLPEMGSINQKLTSPHRYGE